MISEVPVPSFFFVRRSCNKSYRGRNSFNFRNAHLGARVKKQLHDGLLHRSSKKTSPAYGATSWDFADSVLAPAIHAKPLWTGFTFRLVQTRPSVGRIPLACLGESYVKFGCSRFPLSRQSPKRVNEEGTHVCHFPGDRPKMMVFLLVCFEANPKKATPGPVRTFLGGPHRASPY